MMHVVTIQFIECGPKSRTTEQEIAKWQSPVFT